MPNVKVGDLIRQRGARVHVLDHESLVEAVDNITIAIRGYRDTWKVVPVTAWCWAWHYERKMTLPHVLGTEGVGGPRDNDHLMWIRDTNGNYTPIGWERLRSIPTTTIDLADFIRTGGARLESNYREWRERWRATEFPDIRI